MRYACHWSLLTKPRRLPAREGTRGANGRFTSIAPDGSWNSSVAMSCPPSLQLDLQELRGGLAEHLPTVRVAEARRFQDVVDRLVLPRDRMVGTDDELAHAHFGRFFSLTPVSMSGATRRLLSERAA